MDSGRVEAKQGGTLLRLVDDERNKPGGHEGSVRAIIRRVGFGFGALVFALVLIGQGIFLSTSLRSAVSSAMAPAAPNSGSLTHRLDVILARALGPSDRGVERFRIVRAFSAAPRRGNQRARRDVEIDIIWAINNDLSGGTVGNGAEAEVYAMLRAVFTARLPIDFVRLSGTYPLRGGKPDSVVMRLSMNRRIANLIGNVGWDNFDPQTLWPLVQRLYINPNLQPQTAE